MANESNRFFRGGSWFILPSSVRVSLRDLGDPGYRSSDLGVRLIRLINTLQQLAETGNEL